METELKTPLAQLPQNDENDTDLVNKILSQLDDSTAESAPVFEEPPAAPPAAAPQARAPAAQTRSVEDVLLPSQQKVNSWYESLDVPVVYSAIKKSAVYAILFLIFVVFSDSFRQMFSKLTFITTSVGLELNMTGKVLQAICFGLSLLILQMFVLKD
tara:strand:- start:407 stop:877 length:471 start_codon:yes stop_codon:yes gene_type:complete